jgi:hypothetical protein
MRRHSTSAGQGIMANEIIPADPSELGKLQFDYAWKWFSFHADQRVKMFNFMLIVFGIFAAGVVNALDKDLPPVAIAGLCFFAAFLAWAFMRLDRRNRDLVWLGEDVLMDLERKAIFGEGQKIEGRYDRKEGRNRKIDFGILWRQALEERRSPNWGPIGNYWRDGWLGKHRVWLPAIGGWIGVLFFAAGLWSLLRPLPH